MRSSLRVFAVTTVSVVALAGCNAPLLVDPAPFANDPVCAQVMLAAPDTYGGLESRMTSSQATLAWGESDPIVARCGVEVPGPSTDICVSVETYGGQVDWVLRQTETHWIATTFGRKPALEVALPKIRVDQDTQSVLGEISLAATYAQATGRECLALTDTN